MAQAVTRDEHLALCKRRALEYVDRGDLMGALTSMFSDLEKHPETMGHAGIQLGVGLMVVEPLMTTDSRMTRRFIEGFN